jgi:hypothetical protein
MVEYYAHLQPHDSLQESCRPVFSQRCEDHVEMSWRGTIGRRKAEMTGWLVTCCGPVAASNECVACGHSATY